MVERLWASRTALFNDVAQLENLPIEALIIKNPMCSTISQVDISIGIVANNKFSSFRYLANSHLFVGIGILSDH